MKATASQDYERAIGEAAGIPSPAEAMRRLAVFADGGALPQPESRTAQLRLAALLLRAGRPDQAERILACGTPGRVPPGSDVWIIDPGLVHLEGHHYNTNAFYHRLAAAHGLSPCVLRALRDHPSFRGAELETIPLFALSPYEPLIAANTVDGLAALNEFFGRQFRRALPRTCPRVLVAHTTRHTFIEGLSRYLCDADHAPLELVVIGVLETDVLNPRHPRHAAVCEIYRRAFAALTSLRAARLLVVVETPEVGDFLSGRLGIPVEPLVMPYVGGWLDEVGAARKPRPARPLVGFVGQTRPERGASLIPEIARRTLSGGAALGWRVQLDVERIGADPSPPLAEALAWLERGAAFERVATNLPLRDYYELMSAIDVMVMPYDPRYEQTGSGIAIESLKFGHVVVAPQRSTMARLARDHGAGLVTFPEVTVDAVASAVLEAAARFDELSARSHRAAAATAAEDTQPLAELNHALAALARTPA